jgi:hypothetical protein
MGQREEILLRAQNHSIEDLPEPMHAKGGDLSEIVISSVTISVAETHAWHGASVRNISPSREKSAIR